MSDSFRVDMGALRQASDGIDGVLQDVRAEQVSEIDPGSAAVGDVRLGESIADFCDRWQIGVDSLAKDSEAIASRLRAAVDAYAAFDHAARDTLVGILQGSGRDPAVR